MLESYLLPKKAKLYEQRASWEVVEEGVINNHFLP
jgi:hypothetical protein